MSAWAVIAAALPLGLVTSVHCVGMCGGTVLAVGGAFGHDNEGRAPVKGFAPHLFFHAGRLVTIASLGAAAGAAGGMISRIGAMAGFHQAGMAVTIVILALVAAHLLGWLPSIGKAEGSGKLAGWLNSIVSSASGAPGSFLLGLLTGFLPCGPLYGALALSVGAGSPVMGALSMAAFWTGTVPLLVVFGRTGGALVEKLRGRTAVAMIVLILGVAITLTAFKMAAGMHPAMAPKAGPAATTLPHGGH